MSTTPAKPTPPIETTRLLLRDPLAEDGDALAEIWADPEVTRYAGGPRDRETVKRLVAEDAAAPDGRRWSVVEKRTGRVVGDCGFVDKEVEGRRETELIYFFARAVWNQGMASEAAAAALRHAETVLGLTRVVALIDPANVASERVAAKLGMTLERELIRKGAPMRLYVWRRGA